MNLRGLRFSRGAALILGVALPPGETWRRFGAFANWPAWLDDYVASGLLLYAWYAGRHSLSESRPYLMAAWGYTLGIAYMSFFGQLEHAQVTDISGFSGGVMLAVKGFGVALSALCLAAAWRGP
ncbi:MAG TPA: hypothetical protein VFL57_00350 [Bryobacteraceae bacterium]|nr:hypothetical protein [Bryobacteraceae bacterium]